MRGVTAITDVQNEKGLRGPAQHKHTDTIRARVASRLCNDLRSYEDGVLACMSYPAKHIF
jgi:hypothetical protein